MKIKDLKEFNKPIQKLIKNGVESLSTTELLAIIINTGTSKESCIDIANNILNSLNELSDILSISFNQLLKFSGVKEKKAALIISAIEFVKRCENSFNPGITIDNKKIIHKLLLPKIINLKVEHIYIFYLDVRLRVIKMNEFKSDIPNAIVLPLKSIIKEAILLDTVFVIVAHNHPSNHVNPSKQDISSTIDLMNALKTVGIELLDHVIVARNNCYSFKENEII
jgi:DNA repair protein RadC